MMKAWQQKTLGWLLMAPLILVSVGTVVGLLVMVLEESPLKVLGGIAIAIVVCAVFLAVIAAFSHGSKLVKK